MSRGAAADPNQGWVRVEKADPAVARRIVNPKRGQVKSVPLLSAEAARRIKEEIFPEYGLADYVQVVSAEPPWRQAPHVSRYDGKLRRMAEIYQKWAPLLWARFEPRPTMQTFNKTSRVGWPDFNHPDDKASVVLQRWQQWLEDPRSFEHQFTIMNVRIQAEPPQKERNYQVVDPDGVVRDRVMTAEERRLSDEEYAARARLVFNKSQLNLGCQPFDTVWHGWLLDQRLCGVNMYTESWRGRMRRYKRALDVKHMERYTAAVMRERYTLIGGNYTRAHLAMEEAPYLQPDSSWRGFWFLTGPAPGWLVQFGSGHSGVAPSQKEALICCICEAIERIEGLRGEECMATVLSGETRYFSLFNYGDDNFASSDEEQYLDQLFAMLDEALDVAEEDPPAFLGFEWVEEEGSFFLPARSYLLKGYIHERAPLPPFRSYPFLGWVEKRRTYLRYGRSRIMEPLFRKEDQLLEREGLPWSEVQRRAEEERNALLENAPSPFLGEIANVLFGKDYLLTPEEKIATGAYDGWDVATTWKQCQSLVAGGPLAHKFGD